MLSVKLWIAAYRRNVIYQFYATVSDFTVILIRTFCKVHLLNVLVLKLVNRNRFYGEHYRRICQ